MSKPYFDRFALQYNHQHSSQLKTLLGYAVKGITDAMSASSYTGTVTVSAYHVRHR